MRSRAALLLFLCIGTSAYAEESSYVADLFKNGELQLEARSQCAEIKRALGEVTVKSRAYLESKRYEDYAGRKNRWTFFDLLKAYFLPSSPRAIDERAFFKDRKSAGAKQAFSKLIEHLGDCSNYAGEQ